MRFTAQALLLAVIMSLIAALICSGWVLMLGYHAQERTAHQLRHDVAADLRSAFAVMQYAPDVFSEADTVELELFSGHKATISTEPWGVYELFAARVKRGKTVLERHAIVGSTQFPSTEGESPNLIALPRAGGIVLAGNTSLRGLIQVGPPGLRPGMVGNEGYRGEALVTGTLQLKKRWSLPGLSEDWMASSRIEDSSQIETEELPENGKSADWSGATRRYRSPAPIQLEASYSGRMIISSEVEIVVHPAATLEQVILVAPKIIIESGVAGRFQALATDSIIVGEDCRLQYPSALLLQSESDQPGGVVIGHRTQVEGFVGLLGSSNAQTSPSCQIETDGTVSGWVYVRGGVELMGTVVGALWTEEFFLRTPASYYENRILGGRVDGPACSKHLLPPNILSDQSPYAILEWLN